MNLRNKVFGSTLLMFLGFLIACGTSEEKGTTKSGRAYKRVVASENKGVEKTKLATPDSTSYVAFRAEIFKDSVIGSIGYADGFPIVVPMSSVLASEGDPTGELLMLAAEGDSIVSTVTAEELMIPDENPQAELELRLKLLHVFDKEEAAKTFIDSLNKIAMQNYDVKMKVLVEQEEKELTEYIEKNALSPKTTDSGLQYIITEEGTGMMPEVGDTVSVHYTGTLLNGEKFDSSLDRNEPIEFILGTGQVIKGWDEGVALLNKGGKATFLIPSNLAYGERGAGAVIPPYSPLKFEVELVDVKKLK